MSLLPLFIFWCLWFLNFSSRSILPPILPLIEDSLHLSHGEAGGFFTSLSLGYSLTMLAVGRFATDWGYKKTVVCGYIGTGLVFAVIQFVEGYVAFHVLLFFLGIATGTYLPAILPIITATYEESKWGRAIGLHETAVGLSIFSIPILTAFGLKFFPWKELLLFIGVACLIFPFFFWKVSVEPKHEHPHGEGNLWRLLRRRTVWIMAFLWGLSAGCAMGIFSILPLYLIKERGMDFQLANTLIGISRVGGIFFPILVGFLIDRYGFRVMLKASLLATGMTTVGLALSSPLPLLIVFLILQAVASTAFFGIGFAAISNLTSLSERSFVLGVVNSLGAFLGIGSTPLFLGVVADRFNFVTGMLALGVVTACSSWMVRFLGNTSNKGGE